MQIVGNRRIWGIAGLIAAFAAASVQFAPVSAEPSSSVRIISRAEEINFPRNVVFRLEAESDANIADVTLFYRLGNQHVTAYGYPNLQSSSDKVTAEFRVETGGANYIPPGTDFEYYYVIRDSNGVETQSDRMILEYKDPSFDWQRLQKDDFTILYHNRSESAVADVAEDVSQRLDDVRQLLGLDVGRPKKAVILNSTREAGESFPLISQTARDDQIFGGFAFGQYDLFLLIGLNRDGIIHELTHLLMDEAVGSPLAQVPAWLNEGLAQYFESGGDRRAATVSDAARRGDLLNLNSMGRVPGRTREVRVFYAQAWSLVDHLMTQYEQTRMTNMLATLNRGIRIEDAIPSAYGITLQELESEWLGTLDSRISPTGNVDPGTFGTSALIAGATAVAVVVIIWRWLRHLSSPRTSPDADDSDASELQ